jgi:hypothetical protein
MDDNQNPNPWESPATTDPQAQPEHEPRQGGDDRQPNFDSAMDVAKELWSEHRSTLLTAWAMFAGIWLMSSLFMGIGGAAVGMDPGSQQEVIENMPGGGNNAFAFFDIFGPGYWAFLAVSMVIGVLQLGVGIATLAPVRQAWFDGRSLSAGEVVGLIGRRIFSGALLYFVYSILVTIGTVLCCIPGLLAAYFLMPTFYLVGGRGDGVFDSISTSFNWGKRHAGLLVILIIITFGVAMGLGVVNFFSSQILVSMGKAGYVVSQLVAWFLGVTGFFFIWVFYAATMISIDQSEEHTAGW